MINQLIARILLLSIAFSVEAYADKYVTLLEGDRMEIPEGKTALIVFVGGQEQTEIQYEQGPSNFVRFFLNATNSRTTNEGTFTSGPSSENPLPLVGPALLITLSDIYDGKGIISIRLVDTVFLTQKNNGLTLPSSTVVIPQNSSAPIDIILESSVDLVTWNSALPGKYSADDSDRFFRVRADSNE